MDFNTLQIGAITSVGQGISIKKLNTGKFSYSATYRDNNSKAKRKVLMTKDKHINKHITEALVLMDKFKSSLHGVNIPIEKEEKEIIIDNSSNTIENDLTTNYLTLNELAALFFESKKTDMTIMLKQKYNYLKKEKEFQENRVVQTKLYNLHKEVLKYNKNIRDSELASIPVNKILKSDILKYTKSYLPTKNLAEKSTYDLITKIKSIINYAIRNQIIDIKNPFQNTIFKNPKKVRENSLSIEEIKLLLETCKAHTKNPNVYLSVYLAVLTAGRSNTILNIRKKDIDIDKKEITLNNFKTNSKRYRIALNDEAVNWLETKVLVNYENDEYLIRPIDPRRRRTPPQPLTVVPKTVYTIMDKLFNKNLNKQNNQDRDLVINFHSIRRSIATSLAEQGASIYNIMVLLNHSSVKQTQDYLNLSNKNLANDTNTLNSNIFNNFGNANSVIPY
ncbi:tyrosine-type recombinase/integrase [Candidatus Sulfurimonas baltica]|uniref:Site-specific integrase n=1 Tax=Candidatus Sulfurimonas baltica TaxID=2740404 RepID=A0A7S7LWN9_9BACT|nr:site-specific integrase [Candidatus Sulfurimonas baltica]QOY52750.1 site-specific integrase [Candidatus Sulfurimonas baltica]